MTTILTPLERTISPPMPGGDGTVAPWRAAMSPPTRPAPPVDESASTDAELVARINDRDQTALAEVYRRHGGAVYGLSRRVLADDALAEDITQDVFLRLWNEPRRFDPQRGALRSFLQREAHSRAIERVRSEEARRRREDRSIEVMPTEVRDLEAEVLGSIESERIRSALERLDPKERAVVIDAYFGGHSYREVASRLGLPEGTVKTRIRSGLARLATLLDDSATEVTR